MTYSPVSIAANRPVADMPATDDVAMCCPSCLDTLTPAKTCQNVGACLDADIAASRGSHRGATVKSAPAAWTISGGVD
jgi:hypothetical protein